MKSNVIIPVSALAILLPTSLCAAANKKHNVPEHPNILCITCEDISPRIGCFGDPVAITPNLDQFAKEAIRYTNMFTTVGVSAPSRSALITGMYPTTICTNHMRTGGRRPDNIPRYAAVPPAGVKCYTEYMRQAGYYCTNNAKTDYQFPAPITAWDECGTSAHWKHAPKGMPFFAIFNFTTTHESGVWEGEERPLLVDPADIIVPPYYPDDPVIRRSMAVMYSNITLMDRQFQEMVDELEEAGLRDDTIIIWYSDNGGPLPREKRAIYETGMKVPFMISFPDGYRAGEIEPSMQMFPDIPATILSIAGIRPPEYMQGRAFLGEYACETERDYVYGARSRMDEQPDKQGAVRDHNFRYVRNYDTDQSNYRPVAYRLRIPMMRRMLELLQRDSLDKDQMKWFVSPRPEEEFYVLADDPYELHNQIANPIYQDDIERLRKEFDRWVAEECPKWNLTEMEALETMWPGLVQPVMADPVFEKTREGIVITSSNEGASYAYQINGKGFNEKHWFIYSSPIRLKKGDVLTAVAVRAGTKNSNKVQYKND